jgi:alkanesulfonate monooxygenase
MSLGVDMSMSGVHAGAWRHPDVRPGRVLDFDFYATTARKAEEGKLDFVFLADALTAFDGTIDQQVRAKPALMHAEARRIYEPITLRSTTSAAAGLHGTS